MNYSDLAEEIIETFNAALADTNNFDDAINLVLDNYCIGYYTLMTLLGY